MCAVFRPLLCWQWGVWFWSSTAGSGLVCSCSPPPLQQMVVHFSLDAAVVDPAPAVGVAFLPQALMLALGARYLVKGLQGSGQVGWGVQPASKQQTGLLRASDSLSAATAALQPAAPLQAAPACRVAHMSSTQLLANQ